MTGLHYMALFVAVPVGLLAGVGVWGTLHRAAAVRRARHRAGERLQAGLLPPTGENGLDREARGPLEQRAVELIHQAQIARGSSSFAGNRGGRLP